VIAVQLTGQWADTLLAAERLHLVKLAIWALASLLVGSVTLAALRLRAAESPLLRHFALQMAAWGAANALLVAWGRSALMLRDLAGAVSLDRLLWFSIGLDVGCVAVGTTLAVAGWSLGRRLGLVGAGLGVILQGAALALLDLQLAAQVVRG
jgi:hypothetical protein